MSIDPDDDSSPADVCTQDESGGLNKDEVRKDS